METEVHYQARMLLRAAEAGDPSPELALRAKHLLAAVSVEREPVAWQYRWKLDGEWTKWRVSDASQKHPNLKDLEERPLYALPPVGTDSTA